MRQPVLRARMLRPEQRSLLSEHCGLSGAAALVPLEVIPYPLHDIFEPLRGFNLR